MSVIYKFTPMYKRNSILFSKQSDKRILVTGSVLQNTASLEEQDNSSNNKTEKGGGEEERKRNTISRRFL